MNPKINIYSDGNTAFVTYNIGGEWYYGIKIENKDDSELSLSKIILPKITIDSLFDLEKESNGKEKDPQKKYWNEMLVVSQRLKQLFKIYYSNKDLPSPESRHKDYRLAETLIRTSTPGVVFSVSAKDFYSQNNYNNERT